MYIIFNHNCWYLFLNAVFPTSGNFSLTIIARDCGGALHENFKMENETPAVSGQPSSNENLDKHVDLLGMIEKMVRVQQIDHSNYTSLENSNKLSSTKYH